MPLPTIATPTFELVLPSNGKKIKYRPFLVKEEKVLILALETGDTSDITRAIKDVLKACVQTRGVKVDQLPTFDIEYLFLNIRARSVGETIKLLVNCPDDNGETQVSVELDINDIKVQKSEDHTIDIDIDGNYKLRMKYPSLDQFINNNFNFEDKEQDVFKMVAACVDLVYDDETAYDDFTEKEMIKFLEQFNSSQFREIEKFFDTMPKLAHKFDVVNPNTGVSNEITLEGLSSFFG
tara:strand:- start:1636 stop:2346 length:711 start_codon:yes stop_codon:yes gene_type:complete